MKVQNTDHYTSEAQRLVLGVDEVDAVFSVRVNVLVLGQRGLIQRCRAVFLKIKDFMIVICGTVVLTVITLWKSNFGDNIWD